ncbi:MAG: cellulose synthase/poly-beta-1,6-N-acetylglucosamine synthase-like glycosyltransferase [Cognaticolwellia sp.]|jgi:cellulose synthase/poly-beta-1,6-N-acetylglucosamine synthase-like glycosyltransferase
MLEYLFWGAISLVFFSYVGYPVTLVIYSGLVQAKRDIYFVLGKASKRSANSNPADLPSVAIIISAFNEANCIEARVRNLEALDYPKDKIKYYIGSDGSSDDTRNILSAIDDPNLVFVNFESNRGKASVLNDLVAISEADYLVFSDANTEFKDDAVSKLMRHFIGENQADAVCGELDLFSEVTGENLDSAYWKYERILKFNESRIKGLLGANGAIYAIRKSLFLPLLPDTVIDDYTVVFQVAVDGGRVLYEPEAVAFEEVAPSTSDEYKRRVRIGSGNYQAFARYLKVLNPSYGVLWFSYFSHKVLRWHTPHLLLAALIVSLLLSFGSVWYFCLFIIQSVVYVLCYKFRDKKIKIKVLKLLVFWVNMNFALGHGALRFYRGGAKGAWDSTNRE